MVVLFLRGLSPPLTQTLLQGIALIALMPFAVR